MSYHTPSQRTRTVNDVSWFVYLPLAFAFGFVSMVLFVEGALNIFLFHTGYSWFFGRLFWVIGLLQLANSVIFFKTCFKLGKIRNRRITSFKSNLPNIGEPGADFREFTIVHRGRGWMRIILVTVIYIVLEGVLFFAFIAPFLPHSLSYISIALKISGGLLLVAVLVGLVYAKIGIQTLLILRTGIQVTHLSNNLMLHSGYITWDTVRSFALVDKNNRMRMYELASTEKVIRWKEIVTENRFGLIVPLPTFLQYREKNEELKRLVQTMTGLELLDFTKKLPS